MALIPNPVYWFALQWAAKHGVPLVLGRLRKPVVAELALFEGSASMRRGRRTIDGVLSLTPAHLAFVSTEASERASVRLLLAEVEGVSASRCRFLGVVPHGPGIVKVRSRRGVFTFTVDAEDGAQWRREIEYACPAASAAR